MGPMRVNWTFPYTTKELIERCDQLEAELAQKMDASISAEEAFEVELADYRERLRKAGVKGWEHAKLDPSGEGYSSRSTPETRFRQNQQTMAKRLKEIQEFRRQLQHDFERQPDRMLKLTIDDVRFFGL